MSMGFEPKKVTNITRDIPLAMWDKSPMASQRLIEVMKARAESLGLDMKAVADRADLGETAFRDILKGRSKNPRSDTLEKIATKGLNWTLAEMLAAAEANKDDIADVRPNGDAPRTGDGRSSARSEVDLARPVWGERLHRGLNERPDLPVYASARAGDDGMVITFDPVDWTLRPDELLRAKRAFGFVVSGDSMEPRIEQGDTVFIHPTLAPRRGDDVLLTAIDLFKETGELTGETRALVKRLVKIEPKAWVVKQYNPLREYRLARDEWQHTYKIVSIKRG